MTLKISMKQSEIWLVNLDPAIGSEMKKVRPALIVNDNALGKLPLKIITPITDWKKHYKDVPWMINIEPAVRNGLTKSSSVDCFQIRCISEERLVKKLGSVTESIMDEVKDAISKVIGIP